MLLTNVLRNLIPCAVRTHRVFSVPLLMAPVMFTGVSQAQQLTFPQLRMRDYMKDVDGLNRTMNSVSEAARSARLSGPPPNGDDLPEARSRRTEPPYIVIDRKERVSTLFFGTVSARVPEGCTALATGIDRYNLKLNPVSGALEASAATLPIPVAETAEAAIARAAEFSFGSEFASIQCPDGERTASVRFWRNQLSSGEGALSPGELLQKRVESLFVNTYATVNMRQTELGPNSVAAELVWNVFGMPHTAAGTAYLIAEPERGVYYAIDLFYSDKTSSDALVSLMVVLGSLRHN